MFPVAGATQMAGPLYQRLLSTRQRHRALKVMDSTSSGLCPQGFEFPRTRSLGLKLDERSTLADVRVRMPGVEPGSQAWEACMIPLHYMRCCIYVDAGLSGRLLFCDGQDCAKDKVILPPCVIALPSAFRTTLWQPTVRARSRAWTVAATTGTS